jgi:hypothetical protein
MTHHPQHDVGARHPEVESEEDQAARRGVEMLLAPDAQIRAQLIGMPKADDGRPAEDPPVVRAACCYVSCRSARPNQGFY